MRPALRLLKAIPRLPVHITFYKRVNCGLCVQASDVLARVWNRRPFEFEEVDVMAVAGHDYEFDVPVIHVVPTVGTDSLGPPAEATKLMHRLKEGEVIKAIDAVVEKSGGKWPSYLH